MAINTFKIPYQYYNNEADLVSPAEISAESIDRIKNSKIGAKVSRIFFGRY